MLPQPGGVPGNKTGTLNTKSVTASMLATDSPILPHKLNGSYTQQVEDCFQIFFMNAWNFLSHATWLCLTFSVTRF